MFSAGERFERFCENISRDICYENPTLLLINGDFVDFLAEPGARCWNPARAKDWLRELFGRQAFEPVLNGLRRFLSCDGAQLTIVLGNHDLELALTEVTETLTGMLANNDPLRRSRIETIFDGCGYRFQVGNAKALAAHGNETDGNNFTRFDELRRINYELRIHNESAFSDAWCPSAGAAFVVDAVNKVKRNLPFVDLLKPDEAAVSAIVTLAPQYLSLAQQLAEMKAASIVNDLRRPASELRFLSSGADVGPSAKPDRLAIERRATEYVRNPNLSPDDLIYGDWEGTLGVGEWISRLSNSATDLANEGISWIDKAGNWVGDQVDQSKRKFQLRALRSALHPYAAVNKLAQLSSSDEDLLKMVKGSYDVVFAGHTHARRFAQRRSPTSGKTLGWYINTGTWAGLMSVDHATLQNDDRFGELYDLLRQRDRNALQQSRWFRNECTVAVMQTGYAGCELSLKEVDEQGNLVDPELAGESNQAVIA
ncbi:hypothetical protein CGZ80_00095 [Rhodopirellula sp. MGV]|nr:hypothetical protein CGZ80_00095 [Rhodopirellula sp. MGV]